MKQSTYFNWSVSYLLTYFFATLAALKDKKCILVILPTLKVNFVTDGFLPR